MKSFEDLEEFVASIDDGPSIDSAELRELLEELATIQPPQYEYVARLVTLSDRGDSVSRKPGNIVLNWRRFFEVGPDMALAAMGAAGQQAFGRTLIALYVWNKVWRTSETKLTDAEASVIEALWRNAGRARKIDSDDAFAHTNALRESRSHQALMRPEFERAVDVLVKMQCIQLTDGEIRLCELVRKNT